MAGRASVYIGPDGRLSGVSVSLDVNGVQVDVDFAAEQSEMLALFPDDADTIHDDFTPISRVVLPVKPVDDASRSQP